MTCLDGGYSLRKSWMATPLPSTQCNGESSSLSALTNGRSSLDMTGGRRVSCEGRLCLLLLTSCGASACSLLARSLLEGPTKASTGGVQCESARTTIDALPDLHEVIEVKAVDDGLHGAARGPQKQQARQLVGGNITKGLYCKRCRRPRRYMTMRPPVLRPGAPVAWPRCSERSLWHLAHRLPDAEIVEDLLRAAEDCDMGVSNVATS